MTSISAYAISETLDQVFRAALMLTGRADSAENAVLEGIAALQSADDVKNELIAKTVESVIRQRPDFPNQLEEALRLLPQDLQRLILLFPFTRDCFILRILFGIRPENCATILNLKMEEFEELLCRACLQLSMLETR